MSALLEAQLRFFTMLSDLFTEAVRLRLPIKPGRLLCCPSCSSVRSLHRLGLAIDLPMVWPDGRYGTWEEYLPLGEFWERMGGAWGGRFDLNGDGIRKDDANHFSLAWEGRR